MKAQSIAVTGLPGPRKPVFEAHIDIKEQEGVTELVGWECRGDTAIAERLHKLLMEIVAERNKSAD